MNKFTAVSLLLIINSGALAQTGTIAGRWEFTVETSFRKEHIVMELAVEGNTLTGSISRSDPPGQKPAELSGEVDGDSLHFTVRSPDGLRTITVTGVLAGNSLSMTRSAEGEAGRGPGDSFYGLNGPDSIQALRVLP